MILPDQRVYAPEKYAALKSGDVYVFETFSKRGATRRRGSLRYVSTKWRDNKDDKGKITSRELVGDRVVFGPLPPDDVRVWSTGEELKVYAVTVGCGLFRILEETSDDP